MASAIWPTVLSSRPMSKSERSPSSAGMVTTLCLLQLSTRSMRRMCGLADCPMAACRSGMLDPGSRGRAGRVPRPIICGIAASACQGFSSQRGLGRVSSWLPPWWWRDLEVEAGGERGPAHDDGVAAGGVEALRQHVEVRQHADAA